MGRLVRLLHSTDKSRVEEVLKAGIRAESAYFELDLEMRRGVVYCWLRAEDDKMSGGGPRPDYVYLEVTVDENRCVVADMDLCSIAQMYSQGTGSKPRNPEASRLFAEAYRVTAVPLSQYTPGMFWSPEVLVKGDIAPDCVRLMAVSKET